MRWFRPLGPVFAPVSVMGWVVTLAAVAFCVNTFLAIDHRSHSVSDTLYGLYPFWAPTFLAWAWIAERTARAPAFATAPTTGGGGGPRAEAGGAG